MLKALLSAARRQPVITALVLVALGLAIFLIVRSAKEGFKYNCEESWATCKSDTNPQHCYWGGGKKTNNTYQFPSVAGMCCEKPWSWSTSQCSKPRSGGGVRRLVNFYDDADYKGAVYSYDVTDMQVNEWKELAPNFGGMNDKITSIKVPYGYLVTVWGGAGYTDEKLNIEKDTPNLGYVSTPGNEDQLWGARISSAKVFRKF